MSPPLQLLAAGFALMWFVDVALGPYLSPNIDLAPVVTAGRLVATGQRTHLYAQDRELYNRAADPTFRGAARDSGIMSEPTPFVYPPLVAFALQAVSGITFPTLARLWAVASVGLTLLSLYLTLAVYLPQWNRPLVWAAMLLALCLFEPVLYGLWLGQTTVLIFCLMLAAIAWQRRGHSAAAGLALAVAIFIKLTPVVVAAVWAWRGPRRAVLWCAGLLAVLWLASLVSMGSDSNAAYLSRLMAIGGVDLVAYNNHSLLAAFSRPWFPPKAWTDWRMHSAPALALLLTRGALAAGALTAWRGVTRLPPSAERLWRAPAEGLAIVFMLLAPNIAWTHYFVFLLPVMAILLSGQRPGPHVAGWAVAVAFGLCCRPILPPQNNAPALLHPLLISTPTIAAVLLGVMLCLAIYQSAGDVGRTDPRNGLLDAIPAP